MQLLRLVIDGLPNFNGKLDIDFVAQQRVAQDNKESLYNVFSKIYVNKVISFVGINASGKTTILKAISFAIKMLNNEPINSIKSKEILNDLELFEKVLITAYFYDEGTMYKLETYIEKKIVDVDEEENLLISDEFLWSKNISSIKTKKSMYDFQMSDLLAKRDNDEKYLMNDVSIIVAVNKKNDDGFYLRDMLVWTDHNMLSVLGKFPKELLTFLDPSIEYIECSKRGKEKKKIEIRLKFYGKNEVIINSVRALESYLSSGTVKGLSVFMNAVWTFYNSGYLMIDEIENHFNQEIVATLIRFFKDSRVNKNSATLIYSTHYSELLDEFDRNDCIYIVKNREGIVAENLSSILKRNDMKKSEVYNSGYLDGTVPAYDAYMALKKALIELE